MILDATLGGPVQQASVSFSTNGANTIVAGLTGKSIKVLQLFLVAAGASNLTLKSGSTALSGALTLAINQGFTFNYNQLPLTCAVGDAFVIASDSGNAFGGTIWYVQS